MKGFSRTSEMHVDRELTIFSFICIYNLSLITILEKLLRRLKYRQWSFITGKVNNGMRYNDIKVYKIYLNIWSEIFGIFKISNSSWNKLYQKENSFMVNPTKIHPEAFEFYQSSLKSVKFSCYWNKA